MPVTGDVSSADFTVVAQDGLRFSQRAGLISGAQGMQKLATCDCEGRPCYPCRGGEGGEPTGQGLPGLGPVDDSSPAAGECWTTRGVTQ